MIRVNLLPVRSSKRQEAAKNELMLFGVGVAILLVLLAILHIAVLARVNSAEAENVLLNQEIARKKELLAEVEQAEALKAELETKLQVIKELKAHKSGPVHMLEELAVAAPEKLMLTSIAEKDNKILLGGLSVSNEVISQFLSNLEQSPYFRDVYLNAIDQVEKDGVKLKNFSVTARLVVPGVADADPAASTLDTPKGG